MTAAVSATADLPTVEHALDGQHSFFSNAKVASTSTVGLLHNAVLPSFGLHGGLSVIAYGIARSTNRVEIKDYLWPSGMVINAWWTAVGRHALASGASPLEILHSLSYSQKLLLGAVTAWGTRLFYRIVKRGVSRGKDDVRYENVKQQAGFWNKASLLFALEALFQCAISLPFNLPFRADTVTGFTGASAEWAQTTRLAAAGIFTAGLALETLADWQLDSHKNKQTKEMQEGKQQQSGDLLRTGVWSIVRHPNYLGDSLVHLAFPLWNYGCQLFTWPQLLGPAANYFFLRWIGGDRENEASQAERYSKESKSKSAQFELYQLQKHSFWPSLFELANPWTWLISGMGAAGAAAAYFYEYRIAAAFTAVNPANLSLGETVAGLQ
ncbi:hypothetical protein BST61_g2085 [Cercospora zeina]